MNVQAIGSGVAFRGLWAKEYTVEKESWYGGELDINNYRKAYYPFKDETKEEIDRSIDEFERAHRQEYSEDALSVDYYYAEVKPPLKITKNEYDFILSKKLAPIIKELSQEDYKDLSHQQINSHLWQLLFK